MRRPLALVLLAVIVACTSGAQDAARDAAYVDDHERRIAAHLLDPAGAEFQGSAVYRREVPVVCGRVNAKNAYGGRTGYQRFVSGGDVQVLEREMVAGEMDKVWERFCR